MKKLFITLIAGFLSLSPALTQTATDAFRFSQVFPGGTSRYSSMGGSFGALGGDFSTLSVNPAGLGIYRSSEFTISPVLNYSTVESQYFNTWDEDMKYNFNLNNLGVVFSFPMSAPDNNNGWQFLNVGFGINRHTNFNNRWIAEGFNPYSSKMAGLLQQAEVEGNVDNFDHLSTGLAWETLLLGIDDDGFFVDMLRDVHQRQETDAQGHIRELVLSMGANYNDRIYLGATVGFPTISFEEKTYYRETDTENLNEIFNSMSYITRLRTEGTGYNFKFGAIVRLTDMVRIGGAFHTPTFYDLTERFNATMKSTFDQEFENQEASANNRFDFDLETPLRAMGGLGLVFGTTGAINIDYEYTDYTSMRLRTGDTGASDHIAGENRVIRDSFAEQHSIRVGGEINLDPVILRAGYGYYSNPYRSGVNDAQRSIISAGFGFRERDYFIDFSYAYSFYSEDYFLYMLRSDNPEDYDLPAGSGWEPPVTNRDFTASTFRLTFGWRF